MQQIKPHAQPPPKQMKSSGVQSVINGEDRNVNNVYNTDPMLLTCDNKTDISSVNNAIADSLLRGQFQRLREPTSPAELKPITMPWEFSRQSSTY